VAELYGGPQFGGELTEGDSEWLFVLKGDAGDLENFLQRLEGRSCLDLLLFARGFALLGCRGPVRGVARRFIALVPDLDLVLDLVLDVLFVALPPFHLVQRV